MTVAFRAPESEAERTALTTILCDAFAAPIDAIEVGMTRCGEANQRVAVDDGSVVAGLWEIPMGQWFGGRVVPCTGVAAVGVDAGRRGTGVGDALMAAFVREQHAAGAPISCLYPATLAFYRRAGYELAGSRHRIELALKPLRVKPIDAATVRAGRVDDEPAIEEAHEAFCAGHAGGLSRGPYIWARVRQPGGKTARTWVVEQDGAITGHVRLTSEASGGQPGYEVRLSDVSVTTPESVRAVGAFLSGHRSLSSQAVFFGSERHPLLLGLPEWSADVRLDMHWMVRVTHLESALLARGWSPGAAGEVTLDVVDPLLPEQSGGWRLAVADGRAQVERCDAGAVRITERGLAALYTGFLSPRELTRQGLAEGASADLDRLGALFAGPSPWMADMF